MITQDVEVTRRILQEAHTLTDAGYSVRIITRSADTPDSKGTVEGLPVEWVAVQRARPALWLALQTGRRITRNSAAALWSVLTGRHTFTLRATPARHAAPAPPSTTLTTSTTCKWPTAPPPQNGRQARLRCP